MSGKSSKIDGRWLPLANGKASDGMPLIAQTQMAARIHATAKETTTTRTLQGKMDETAATKANLNNKLPASEVVYRVTASPREVKTQIAKISYPGATSPRRTATTKQSPRRNSPSHSMPATNHQNSTNEKPPNHGHGPATAAAAGKENRASAINAETIMATHSTAINQDPSNAPQMEEFQRKREERHKELQAIQSALCEITNASATITQHRHIDGVTALTELPNDKPPTTKDTEKEEGPTSSQGPPARALLRSKTETLLERPAAARKAATTRREPTRASVRARPRSHSSHLPSRTGGGGDGGGDTEPEHTPKKRSYNAQEARRFMEEQKKKRRCQGGAGGAGNLHQMNREKTAREKEEIRKRLEELHRNTRKIVSKNLKKKPLEPMSIANSINQTNNNNHPQVAGNVGDQKKVAAKTTCLLDPTGGDNLKSSTMNTRSLIRETAQLSKRLEDESCDGTPKITLQSDGFKCEVAIEAPTGQPQRAEPIVTSAAPEMHRRIGLLRKTETRDHSFSAIKDFSFDKENVALAMLTPTLPSNAAAPPEMVQVAQEQLSPEEEPPAMVVVEQPAVAAVQPKWQPITKVSANHADTPIPPSAANESHQSSHGVAASYGRKKASQRDRDSPATSAAPAKRQEVVADLPYWLKPSAVQVYPYNFIMAVRRKLEAIAHIPGPLDSAKTAPQAQRPAQCSTATMTSRWPHVPSTSLLHLETPLTSLAKLERSNRPIAVDVKRRIVEEMEESPPPVAMSPPSRASAIELSGGRTSTKRNSIDQHGGSVHEVKISSNSHSSLPTSQESLFRTQTISRSSHRSCRSSSAAARALSAASSVPTPLPERQSIASLESRKATPSCDDSTTAPSSVFGSPEKKPRPGGGGGRRPTAVVSDFAFALPRPLSPLSLDRVGKLKVHTKLEQKTEHKHRTQAAAAAHIPSSGKEKELNGVAETKITMATASTTLSPPSPAASSTSSSAVQVNFNQLLDDFNRSLSQVIQVNEQLKSTLDKSHQLFSPRDSTATTTASRSKENQLVMANREEAALKQPEVEEAYSSDFEESSRHPAPPLPNVAPLKIPKRDLFELGRVQPLQLISPTSDVVASENMDGGLGEAELQQPTAAPPEPVTLISDFRRISHPINTSTPELSGQQSSSSAAVASVFSPRSSRTPWSGRQSYDISSPAEHCSDHSNISPVKAQFKLQKSQHSMSPEDDKSIVNSPPQGKTFVLRRADDSQKAVANETSHANDGKNASQSLNETEASIEEDLQITIGDSLPHKLKEQNIIAPSKDHNSARKNKRLASAHYIRSHVNGDRGDFFEPADAVSCDRDSQLEAAIKEAAAHTHVDVPPPADGQYDNPPPASVANSQYTTTASMISISMAPPSYRTAAQPTAISTEAPPAAAGGGVNKRNASDLSVLGSDATLDISQLLAAQYNDSLSESSANYSSVGLYKQLIQTETTKSEHLTVLLRLREKALLDRTKGQISLLEAQKERYKTKGLNAQIATIKKKQRGILLKMAKERDEIKRLLHTACSSARSSEDQRRCHHHHQQQQLLQPIKTPPLSPLPPSSANLAKDHRRPNKINRDVFHASRTTTTTTTRTTLNPPSACVVAKSPASSSLAVPASDGGGASSWALSAQGGTFLRATYELESSRSLEELLKRREEDLRRRREHVERLMQWHRRLDQEEAEVLELEQQLLGYNNAHVAHSPQKRRETQPTPEERDHQKAHISGGVGAVDGDGNGVSGRNADDGGEQRGAIQTPTKAAPNTPTKVQTPPAKAVTTTPPRPIASAVHVHHSPRRRVRSSRMERRLREIDRSLRELSGIATGHGSATTSPGDSGGDVTADGSISVVAVSSADQEPHDFIRTSGSKLNKLWRRLTAQQTEKFEPNGRYKLCKTDLERLYEEAKIAVLQDFARDEERCAAELLLEKSISHFTTAHHEGGESDQTRASISSIIDADVGRISPALRTTTTANVPAVSAAIAVVPHLQLSTSSALSEQEDEGIREASTPPPPAPESRVPPTQGDYCPRAAQEDFYNLHSASPKDAATSPAASTLSSSSASESDHAGAPPASASSKEAQRQMQEFLLHVQQQRLNGSRKAGLQRSLSDTQIEQQQQQQNVPSKGSSSSSSQPLAAASQRNLTAISTASSATSAHSLTATTAKSSTSDESDHTTSPPPTAQTVSTHSPSPSIASSAASEVVITSATSAVSDGSSPPHQLSASDEVATPPPSHSNRSPSWRERSVIRSVGRAEALSVISVASGDAIESLPISSAGTVPPSNSTSTPKSSYSGQMSGGDALDVNDVESKARLISEKLDEISAAVSRLSVSNALPPTYQQSTKASPVEDKDTSQQGTTTAESLASSRAAAAAATPASYSTQFEAISTDDATQPNTDGVTTPTGPCETIVPSDDKVASNPSEFLDDSAALPEQSETDTEAAFSSSALHSDKEEENEQQQEGISDAYELEFESSAVSDQTFIGDLSLPQFETTLDTTQDVVNQSKVAAEEVPIDVPFETEKEQIVEKALLPPPPPPPATTTSLPLSTPSTPTATAAVPAAAQPKRDLPPPPPPASATPPPDAVRREHPLISPAEEELLKQLEHITAVPYYVREIPNKPPPPYVPPAHGSPMTTIFPAVERIKDIAYRRTHELYCQMMQIAYANEKGVMLTSVIDEKITNIYERIILDICREYLHEHKDALAQGDPVNYHSQLAFFNPPNRLRCLQESVYKEVRRCLAMDKTRPKRTQVYSVYGQRAKRDHIGKIIIQEMYDEDDQWCNFHREEDEVLELVVEEMVTHCLENVAKELLLQEGGTIDEVNESIAENSQLASETAEPQREDLTVDEIKSEVQTKQENNLELPPKDDTFSEVHPPIDPISTTPEEQQSVDTPSPFAKDVDSFAVEVAETKENSLVNILCPS